MNAQQKTLDEFFKKKGWKYWHPLAQLARLVEEVGELARVINHRYGEKPKKPNEKKQDLEGELGDVIYTANCIANATGIDLDKAFEKSFNKVKERDKNRY